MLALDVVVLLILEPVPGRLTTPPPLSRSGVFLDCRAGDLGVRVDPTEESDAREAAEPMASGWIGDQTVLFDAGGDKACSRDACFRNC